MSDLDAYRSLYVAESRENLEGIVSNLLVLEKGTDSHAIDEIFRSAHSLKGMSASMGFSHMEEICHALEDVFSQIRSGRLEVTQSLVDDLLGGADDIELMIDEIEAGGDGQLDHKDQRVKSLKRWLSADEEKEVVKPAPKTPAPIEPPSSDTAGDMYEGPAYDQDYGSGCLTYSITFSLADNVDNKNLRGMLILQNLESIGEIVTCSPERTIVEDDENFTGNVTLEFRTNAGKGAIETILGVSDIKTRTISEPAIPAEVSGVPLTKDEPAIPLTKGPSDTGVRYEIHVEISSSVDSRNLRSMLLLQNLEGLGTILHLSPKREIIEDSDTYNGVMDILLSTVEPQEKIHALLKGSDIKNYSVMVEVPEISKEPGAALEGSDSTSFAGIRASSADKAERKNGKLKLSGLILTGLII
jgi:two-component system chemotaxis sensor kinase CheA